MAKSYFASTRSLQQVKGKRQIARGSGQRPADADVGVDGTFWGIRGDELVRFAGTEWTSFEPPDWSRTAVAMRALAEDGDGWVPSDLDRSPWGEPHVALDGSEQIEVAATGGHLLAPPGIFTGS